MKTVTLPLYAALITNPRSKDAIPVEVPKHELLVLRAIHGEPNVLVQGETDETVDLPASAGQEIGRLATKYRQIGQKSNPVGLVFRSADELDRFGFEAGGEVRNAPQAGVRRHDKPAKAEAKQPEAKDAAKAAK